MATVTKSLKYDVSTAALYGALWQGIHDSIVTTAGWVHVTADTGQAQGATTSNVLSITTIERTTTVAKITFAAPHGLLTGQTITVLTSGTFSPTASGTFVITGVPSSTTATYTTSTGTIASVADTGTITHYVAASGYLYRIYRMNDTLAGSGSPVYMKLSIGKGSTGPAFPPWYQLQFGQGSDGAGSLTGYTSTPVVHNSASTGIGTGATVYLCYFAGDTNRFSMALHQSFGVTQSAAPFGFQVERSKSQAGADTATYLHYEVFSNSGTFAQEAIFLGTGTGTGQITGKPVAFPVLVSFNNHIIFCPTLPVIGEQGNPVISGLVPTSVTTGLSTPTIAFYGVNHTMLLLANAPFNSSASSSTWAMRFE